MFGKSGAGHRKFEGDVSGIRQKKGCAVPSYHVLEKSGPDHARHCLVEVTVSTYAYRGEGSSRREAEKICRYLEPVPFYLPPVFKGRYE